MSYAERAYFDGDHCHHVAAHEEHLWDRHRQRQMQRAERDRRRGSRTR